MHSFRAPAGVRTSDYFNTRQYPPSLPYFPRNYVLYISKYCLHILMSYSYVVTRTLGNEVFEQHPDSLSQWRHFPLCVTPEGSIFLVCSSSALDTILARQIYFTPQTLLHDPIGYLSFYSQSLTLKLTKFLRISQIVDVLNAVPTFIVYCMNFKVLYYPKPHVIQFSCCITKIKTNASFNKFNLHYILC